MFVLIVCEEGPGCRGMGKAKRYFSPQVLLFYFNSLRWIMAFIYLPGTTVGGLPLAMPTIGSVDGGSAPVKEQGRGERQGFAPCFPVAFGALWGNRTVGLFLFWLAAASSSSVGNMWECGPSGDHWSAR